MGIFDIFSRKDIEGDQNSRFSASFSSRNIRISCKKNDQGIIKCKKYTSEDDQEGVDFDLNQQNPNEDEGFESLYQALENFGNSFGNPFENLSKTFEHFASTFPDFFPENKRFPKDFSRPHRQENFHSNPPKSQPSQNDTNIFDV